MATGTQPHDVYRVAVRRALTAGDASNLQLHFDPSVLDRYRGAAGFSLIRTNSVGRLRKEGGWSLDLGIPPEETSIHASFADLARLPEDERTHWASMSLAGNVSRMFLQMRLAPGACYDDGEVRAWN